MVNILNAQVIENILLTGHQPTRSLDLGLLERAAHPSETLGSGADDKLR